MHLQACVKDDSQRNKEAEAEEIYCEVEVTFTLKIVQFNREIMAIINLRILTSQLGAQLMPDVSGTYSPHPNNGGRLEANVIATMSTNAACIEKTLKIILDKQD